MGLNPSPARGLSRQPVHRTPESWSSRALGIGVEQHAETFLLRLTGEFDWACVGRVEAALERVSEATRHVVFDLQGLTFLDSRGLRTILRANERARDERFDVVVVRPRGLASRLFTLTHAGEKLTMVDRVRRRARA